MKHRETIADRLVKNINSALDAIPRALHLEGETKMRRTKTNRKPKVGTKGRRAAARKGAGKARASLAAKRGRPRTVKPETARAGRSATLARGGLRKTRKQAAKKRTTARKAGGRKAPRAAKQAVRYIAPIAQAA